MRKQAILIFVAVLVAGCGAFPPLQPSLTADPSQASHSSLQEWAQPQLKALGPVPRYTIRAGLSPSGDELTGQMRVIVPNSEVAPLPDLLFRLYPNTPHYGGEMAVTQVQVDGQSVVGQSEAEGTALRISLPTPLEPDDEVRVSMSFAVNLPRGDGDYTLFGWEDGILSLPGFYPTLAPRHNGDWVANVPPLFADALFNPVALYDLEFVAPARLTVVASGTVLEVTDSQGEGRIWRIAGGPLRDMTILASDRWASVSDMAAGASVTSYYPEGFEAAGQATLFHAAAALRLYSDLYGPYPYTEFNVVAAPLGFRGMEYSGLVTIGEGLYGPYRDRLAFLVAHETAHQWWYAQVGNDPFAHPWLDEGLAEYSAFNYYRGVYGQVAAEELLSARWRTPYAVAAANGIDGPVAQPASAMTAANYELLAYAKSALFFDALRRQLGDEIYSEVMRAYVETYRWQIVSPQGFFGLAQSVSGANLNPLAEEWLR